MSGVFAEFVDTELVPFVEERCGVKLTSDPNGRAIMGGSSGGSAAFTAAFYRPDLFRRVLTCKSALHLCLLPRANDSASIALELRARDLHFANSKYVLARRRRFKNAFAHVWAMRMCRQRNVCKPAVPVRPDDANRLLGISRRAGATHTRARASSLVTQLPIRS